MNTIPLQEPSLIPPCDLGCKYREHCGVNNDTCVKFKQWVNTGVIFNNKSNVPHKINPAYATSRQWVPELSEGEPRIIICRLELHDWLNQVITSDIQLLSDILHMTIKSLKIMCYPSYPLSIKFIKKMYKERVIDFFQSRGII